MTKQEQTQRTAHCKTIVPQVLDEHHLPALADSVSRTTSDFLEQAITSSVDYQLERQLYPDLTQPAEMVIGGEALPPMPTSFGIPHYDAAMRDLKIRDTLKEPSNVNLAASNGRIRLLEETGSLNEGLDAAESISAKNSLEKMLAHQMTACHQASMRMLAKAEKESDAASAVRFANVGGRLSETFQKGLLTLHRIRTGGGQTVVVKHMTVNDGGQAVVANTVETGGNKKLGVKGKT